MNISELLEHCLNTQLYQSGEQAQKEESKTTDSENKAEQTEEHNSQEEKPKNENEDEEYNS